MIEDYLSLRSTHVHESARLIPPWWKNGKKEMFGVVTTQRPAGETLDAGLGSSVALEIITERHTIIGAWKALHIG